MLQPYCPNSVIIILLSFLSLPSVLEPSNTDLALIPGYRRPLSCDFQMATVTIKFQNSTTGIYLIHSDQLSIETSALPTDSSRPLFKQIEIFSILTV